jgi:hypothetical protein
MRALLGLGLLVMASGVSWADDRMDQYPPGWERREMRRQEEMRREEYRIRAEERERRHREWCWHHPGAC